MTRTAPPVAEETRTRRRVGRYHAGPGIGTYVVLVIALLLSIFPFYWMFVVASNGTDAINRIPPEIMPGPNFLDNVSKVFERVAMDRAMLNSAIVATVVASFQTFLAALAGFAFAKLRFRGRNVLFVFVVATMMVPLQLGVVPLFMITKELGLVNNLLAVILPGLVGAFGVFWMRQHIAGAVPDEVIQAARVDGASSFRTFRSVVFPMVRPAAAILWLLTFLGAWNDFFWPLIVLGKPESFTAQVALRQIQNTAYVTDFGVDMAGTVIVTLPLLILALVVGRQLIKGIMEGAVKG
ncbi:MAG: carbohydrate ABC transporter permease [Chloroflexi bacterium]|nr:carbohydrate ABC transporter permease [Chloroflexota bacterium]